MPTNAHLYSHTIHDYSFYRTLDICMHITYVFCVPAIDKPSSDVWRPDEVASVGELLLDITSQLAKT